jgi:hypothetical protein
VPVDEVAGLLRRWRDAGGAWSRGRVLLDAAQLAGRLTPEERRSVAVALADTGAPDLARQLEARTGQPVDAHHLQAFADGLLELEGARLDQVIAALEAADARLTATGPDTLLPPPPGAPSTVTAEDEALDQRLRDLAALEHLGDEELQGIRLGEIELGSPTLGEQDLGQQELGQAVLGEVGLTEVGLSEVGLSEVGLAEAALAGAAATAPDEPTPAIAPSAPADPAHDHTPGTDAAPLEVAADAPSGGLIEEAPAPGPASAHTTVAPAEPDDHTRGVTTEPRDAALVPAAAAPRELTPRETAAALTRISGRLANARTAAARLALLSPETTRDLDASAALLVLDQVPAGWQRRRAATRLFAAGALAGVAPAELLARFPAAQDRRFVAADLLDASGLTADDLAGDLPPRVVRRLAIRAER